jgi:hypothetical protein
VLIFENAVHRTNYIYVTTYDRQNVLLYWKYKPTLDTINTHTISIYKSEGLTADGIKIATISAINTHYVDNTPNIYDKFKHVYYQLQINDGALTDKVTFDNKPMSRTLHRRKNVNTTLRVGGIPCLIYQKKTEEDFCPLCWDDLTRKARDPVCPTCFGTGRTGGWYTPVYTLYHVNPPEKAISHDDIPKQIQDTQAFIGYYPTVNPKDMIFDLTVGEYWRIESIHPVRDAYDIIYQELNISKIAHREGAYLLPVPSKELNMVITPSYNRKYLIDLDQIKESLNG